MKRFVGRLFGILCRMAAPPPLEESASATSVRLQHASATDAPSRFLLLDCRTADEYAVAHIDGSRLIPMQELPARLAELESWRDKPIVVHCHHGMRSLKVAQWLREQGFSFAQSMTGGIDAWSAEIDPAVPRY